MELLKNTEKYIEHFLKIKTKDNRVIPFRLNAPQRRLYSVIATEAKARKPIRIIILKARQMGFSTLTEAVLFHKTATKANVSTMIIAHKDEATTNLFNMSKLFYEELPDPLKPMRKNSNAKELVFENPTKNPSVKKKSPGLRSKLKCATAGGRGVGRSDTFTNVHASEFAFWEGDKKNILGGLMQAVPNLPGTIVMIESTANGFDEFKTMWDAAVNGENDFIPVFFPWFEMAEYRMPYAGETLTAEERELSAAYQLLPEQVMWRRWCIKNNCGGDLNLFKQEYPASPEEAFIATGTCIFDKNLIILRLAEVRKTKPLKVGQFVYEYDGLKIKNIHWQEDEKGIVRIYEEMENGVPYVIGGDTAGYGSDNFTGQVLNNITGKQCAVLRHQFDEDLYAKQMYCLGMYYNTALLGVETNFSTYPIRELERLGYPKQYVREVMDSYSGSLRKSFGFHTNSVTRPVIIGEFVTFARECMKNIADEETLKEMLTFVKNTKGRPEAEQGEHDDLVMGFAIALGIRSQQRTERENEKRKKAEWTADLWEDYRNADSKGKEYLMDKYGNPF